MNADELVVSRRRLLQLLLPAGAAVVTGAATLPSPADDVFDGGKP